MRTELIMRPGRLKHLVVILPGGPIALMRTLPMPFDQGVKANKVVSGRVSRGNTRAVYWDLVTNAGEIHYASGIVVKLTPLELQILKPSRFMD